MSKHTYEKHHKKVKKLLKRSSMCSPPLFLILGLTSFLAYESVKFYQLFDKYA